LNPYVRQTNNFVKSVYNSSTCLCSETSTGIILMTTVVANLGGGSDDSFLQQSQEVASCFLQLYLPKESDTLISRSPAQQRATSEVSSSVASGTVADASQDQLAVEVSVKSTVYELEHPEP